MDKRDYLLGVLTGALVATLALWALSDSPTPPERLEPDAPPVRIAPQPTVAAPPEPWAHGTDSRPAHRPVPRWSSDIDTESPAAVESEELETYRFRPLGERERQRLERQAQPPGYPPATRAPDDRPRRAPWMP